MPGMTLKEHARVAIQLLSQDIARRQSYTHLGWREIDGAWYYLHAGGAIGAHGSVAGIEVVLGEALSHYQLLVPPTAEAGREAIQASVQMLEVAPDAVTIPIYASIWRAVLGSIDGSLHIVGETGAGKTAVAALAQQHYGAAMTAEGLPASWLSTGNALEGLAFQAKDAVLVVDDFCPTGSTADIQRFHRDADRVLRAQGNRQGRQRMRQDGTLRPPKPPRGLILCTGEDIPQGQSLGAHLLIVEVAKGQVNWQRMTACQHDAAARHYAQALGGFVQWLAPRYAAMVQTLGTEGQALRQQILQTGHRRTPTMVANLLLGVQYFLAYAHDVGAFGREQCQALWVRSWHALGAVAATQQEHQDSGEPITRFLALLVGALTAGQAHVADVATLSIPPSTPASWGWRARESDTSPYTSGEWTPLGACVGWLHGDRLYLEPETAFSVVQKLAETQKAPLPLTQRTLWKRMREKDMIIIQPSQQQNTVTRSIGPDKKSKRVIDIAVAHLSPTNSINSKFSMHGCNAQKNEAKLPYCFPTWYGTQQYANADTNRRPDHAGASAHTSEEVHTVSHPDVPTDFEAETVGTSAPQLIEKSALHTDHTDHTVSQDHIREKCGETYAPCPPPYQGPPPRGALKSGRWVWLYQEDGSPRHDRPVQIRLVRHLDGQTDIQWASSPTEDLRWHNGRLCAAVLREAKP